jgi:hypothetical protein
MHVMRKIVSCHFKEEEKFNSCYAKKIIPIIIVRIEIMFLFENVSQDGRN